MTAASCELEYFIPGSRYVTEYRSFIRHSNTGVSDSLSRFLVSHHQEEYQRFVRSVSVVIGCHLDVEYVCVGSGSTLPTGC